jgi:hypothetical protein
VAKQFEKFSATLDPFISIRKREIARVQDEIGKLNEKKKEGPKGHK